MTAEQPIRRGERRPQPTHVWISTLTVNGGRCVYCATGRATTLDHEEPVAAHGADVWWNLLPACKPCNDWKGGRSTKLWLRDQKLHRDWPNDGFDTRMMPSRMILGFETRIEKTGRDLRNTDRRDWFRHHYGALRHRNKTEMKQHLASCEDKLSQYDFAPWTTPNIGTGGPDRCRRAACCGAS
ncbi:HNH endonuclease signature motif containing protein [Kitasatospora sp. NPDC094016]|uniref:HNH endonuclease n=1 Tax=Kitasatospora sp. NPDC094016 TaxID=3154986 RepID=UPI0033326C9A